MTPDAARLALFGGTWSGLARLPGPVNLAGELRAASLM